MIARNYGQVKDAISARTPFTHPSCSGIAGGAQHLTGWLNHDERQQFIGDGVRGIVYTVVSYGTPIAWLCEDGSVYVTRQKFSHTTSRHQSIARCYLKAAPGTVTGDSETASADAMHVPAGGQLLI